jgi:hypothetical protein
MPDYWTPAELVTGMSVAAGIDTVLNAKRCSGYLIDIGRWQKKSKKFQIVGSRAPGAVGTMEMNGDE